jgi:hypothetical protein
MKPTKDRLVTAISLFDPPPEAVAAKLSKRTAACDPI